MSPNRHQSAVASAYKASQKRKVSYLRDIVRTETVLGQAHTPNENRRLGRRKQMGEFMHAFFAKSGSPLKTSPIFFKKMIFNLFQPPLMLADKCLLNRKPGSIFFLSKPSFHSAVNEGDTPAN